MHILRADTVVSFYDVIVDGEGHKNIYTGVLVQQLVSYWMQNTRQDVQSIYAGTQVFYC